MSFFDKRIRDAVDHGKMPGAADSLRETKVDAPPVLSMLLGGKELNAQQVFIQRVQVRHAVNEIPTATVVLSMAQTSTGNYAALDQVLSRGKVGQPATLKVDKQTVFIGVVGAVQVTSGKQGWQVRVRLKHPLQGLKATIRSRVWKAQQDAALVRDLLANHKVAVGTITLDGGAAVQRMQWNCTDWHFLRALLGLHGAWLWPKSDGKVVLQTPKLAGKSVQISGISGPGVVPVEMAEWTFSGLQHSAGVTIRSWDLSTQKTVKKIGKGATLGHSGLAPTMVAPLGGESDLLQTGQWDFPLQQAYADGVLTAQWAQSVQGSLTLTGYHTCQVGDTVSLEAFGTHLTGQGLVTQVSYQFSRSEPAGNTVIGFGLDEETASLPTLPVPTGLVMGTVASFKADPKGKWNRLPVTIPVLGTEVVWARMGHVYASKDSGVTFYPEVGDEVALAFVGSDPVIVAALHNPERAAAIEPSAKNAKKGIVLRHGGKRAEWSTDREQHTMTLALGDDKKPEQHLLWDATKGLVATHEKGDVKVDIKTGEAIWTVKKNLVLTVDEQLTVTGKTGMKMGSDKDIQLVAKMKLHGTGNEGAKLTSGDSMLALTPEAMKVSAVQTTVQGKESVTITSDAAVALKGRAEVTMNSSGKVAVAGAEVTVKGQAEVSVEAGAAVKVAGATTDLGGAGVTHVKGSLVNLG